MKISKFITGFKRSRGYGGRGFRRGFELDFDGEPTLSTRRDLNNGVYGPDMR